MSSDDDPDPANGGTDDRSVLASGGSDDPVPDAGSSPDPMRAATLVGVASIPVGFLWIHLFGTGSATVLLLASALAGVVYSGRSVPAYRAGARVGLFAPAPEVIVQILSGIRSLLASGLGRDATVVLLGFFVLVAGPALWVIGASLCVLCTAVAGWLVDLTRPYLPRPIGR